MATVKTKGTHGGARPNSGPKPKNAEATIRTRGGNWMKTRERILRRDNYLCKCPECAVLEQPLPADQVDHVIPLYLGGADSDENLQALNADCHKKKSAKEAEQRSLAQYSVPMTAETPLEFLKQVMNDEKQHPQLRLKAAIAAARYEHGGRSEGKKEKRQEAAQEVASKGFASPLPPPRLRVVK